MSTEKIGSTENIFGESLRRFRKSEGLTQDKFAEPLSISGSYVSDIEKGKAVPSEAVIREIVDKYRVSRIYLETGRGAMVKVPSARTFLQPRIPSTTVKIPDNSVSESPLIYSLNYDRELQEIMDILINALPEDKPLVLKLLRGRKESKEALESFKEPLKERL